MDSLAIDVYPETETSQGRGVGKSGIIKVHAIRIQPSYR